MFRRLFPWSVAALAVAAAGVLSSACTVTPVALTVGSDSVATSSINGELNDLTQSPAGGCLLALEHQGLTTSDVVGAGGEGTFTMPAATSVVDNEIAEVLTEQYAASKGVAVDTARLASARTDYEGILQGEIATAVQNSSTNGLAAACTQANGQAFSGQELIQQLPQSLVNDRIRSQAIEEALLARGADLSDRAVDLYYQGNQSLFTSDCVSRIVSDSQSASQALVNQLNAGASFSALAMASSIDTATASQGGSLGCNFTESQVLQSLNIQSAPVGVPIGPLQDTTSGQWIIYEVTSQVVEPLAQATPLIRRELLFLTSNENRVGGELRTFARQTSVYVNPQYGSWRKLTVVPPTPPPAQYLLASSLGKGTTGGSSPSGGRLQLNGGAGG